MVSTSRSFRILTFWGWLLLTAGQAGAQLSPSLSPSLTEETVFEPVTTLSPDLLTPQRVYTYDGTGASIFANALSPEISATVLNSAAETDTAIRDSSQAGQISPYIQSASRLGLSFSGDRGATESAFTSPGSGFGNTQTGEVAGTSFGGGTLPTTGADYDDGYGAEANSAFHSRWEASSPMGVRSADSGWVGKSANVERMGLGTSSASVDSSAVGDYQPSEDQSSNDRQAASGGSSLFLDGDRFAGHNLAFGSAVMPGSAALRSSTSRIFSERSGMSYPATANLKAAAGSSSSATAVAYRSAPSAVGAEAPEGGAGQLTGDNILLFSPRSYSGYAFGATPFSPPVSGDLRFLNPNIFAIRPVRLSSNMRQGDRDHQRRLRTLNGYDELTPSLSTPGLSDGLLSSPLETGAPLTGSPSLSGAPLPSGNLESHQ